MLMWGVLKISFGTTDLDSRFLETEKKTYRFTQKTESKNDLNANGKAIYVL